MLFLDVFAVYLVSLDDPFLLISFPSTYELLPKLETTCIVIIMICDFLFDGLVMGIFLFQSFFSKTNVNALWWLLFALTTFTLFLDAFQLEIFAKYNKGEEEIFTKYLEIESQSEKIEQVLEE